MQHGKWKVNQPKATFMLWMVAFSEYATVAALGTLLRKEKRLLFSCYRLQTETIISATPFTSHTALYIFAFSQRNVYTPNEFLHYIVLL